MIYHAIVAFAHMQAHILCHCLIVQLCSVVFHFDDSYDLIEFGAIFWTRVENVTEK